ncbi:hypothetical protein OIU74_016053 [Salix koriyanagi]|uniref:Uncharacterized protein n=1 Tax=Salix koriyanagi TaxID=2511006 RepID=A0A9Q0PFU1_9ROSI|nr:hypothetical protein OIU74_016053 [Salix koriyanagi]
MVWVTSSVFLGRGEKSGRSSRPGALHGGAVVSFVEDDSSTLMVASFSVLERFQEDAEPKSEIGGLFSEQSNIVLGGLMPGARSGREEEGSRPQPCIAIAITGSSPAFECGSPALLSFIAAFQIVDYWLCTAAASVWVGFGSVAFKFMFRK